MFLSSILIKLFTVWLKVGIVQSIVHSLIKFLKLSIPIPSTLIKWFKVSMFLLSILIGGSRLVYHRERIWFSSTLSCIKEEEEITKPPAYQVINRCLSPLPIK